MEIMKLVKEYLFILKSEGKSINTLRNYEKHFEKFISFCKEHNIQELSTWNGKETREFRTWLIEKSYKPSTINTILATLSGFFVWCVDEGYMKGNPITSRAYVKTTQATPRFLTEEDLKKLEQVFEELPKHVRYIFKLQLATGMRISEAVNVKTEDIICQEKSVYVRVLGKGKKERIVPVMDKEVAKFLIDSKKNKQGKIFDIEKQTALWWAWRIKQQTGIDFKTHRLRHTVATKLLNDGVSIDVVQEVLGHASISTTRRYAKTSNEAVKRLAVKIK